MTTVSIVDMRKHFAEVINTATYTKERFVLMRHNKPVVAIVPMEDYELLEALEDRIDIDDAMAVLRDPEREFLDWDEVKREL
ncbi:MAG: type II toxin-antitoxin system Phd/YefM family antitoxin [Candidatus Neomarinimicrobiota bacterium]